VKNDYSVDIDDLDINESYEQHPDVDDSNRSKHL